MAEMAAGAMLVEQRAGERPLGALFAQHVVLRGREQLVPLLIGMADLVGVRRRIGGLRPRQAIDGERGKARGAGIKSVSACEHSSSSQVLRRMPVMRIMWQSCRAISRHRYGRQRYLITAIAGLTRS